jgi:hypothetical protein
MRSALVIFLSVLCSIPLVAQSADANLASDLEALHSNCSALVGETPQLYSQRQNWAVT